MGTGPYGNAGHMEAKETCSSCCVQDYVYRCRRLVRLMLGKGEIIWRVIQSYRERVDTEGKDYDGPELIVKSCKG